MQRIQRAAARGSSNVEIPLKMAAEDNCFRALEPRGLRIKIMVGHVFRIRGRFVQRMGLGSSVGWEDFALSNGFSTAEKVTLGFGPKSA